MKTILLFLALIAFQVSINESQAQTASQSARCLMFYQITLMHYSKGLGYKSKRRFRRSLKKAAKYLNIKSPNNYKKIIEISANKVESHIKRAVKRGPKAIENYFYKMTLECNGYKYR